jgi:transcriptional regulator with XRE-family HTH domain
MRPESTSNPSSERVALVAERYGTLLRSFRERAATSQRALAREVEISHTLLNRCELGSRVPASAEEVERVAAALGLGDVDRDQLLGAAGYWPSAYLELGPHDPTVRALVLALTNEEMPPDLRRRLRRAVEALLDAVVLGRVADAPTGAAGEKD